jgi:hypothetical protein
MNTDNYEPYGPEWEKEMMKLPKKMIIEMYRGAKLRAKAEAEAVKRAEMKLTR